MATPTQAPAAESNAKPSDERFWVKYSPHHELPISSLASVAWHVFGLVLIVLISGFATFVVAQERAADARHAARPSVRPLPALYQTRR